MTWPLSLGRALRCTPRLSPRTRGGPDTEYEPEVTCGAHDEIFLTVNPSKNRLFFRKQEKGDTCIESSDEMAGGGRRASQNRPIRATTTTNTTDDQRETADDRYKSHYYIPRIRIFFLLGMISSSQNSRKQTNTRRLLLLFTSVRSGSVLGFCQLGLRVGGVLQVSFICRV